jgi:hypothetical protein
MRNIFCIFIYLICYIFNGKLFNMYCNAEPFSHCVFAYLIHFFPILHSRENITNGHPDLESSQWKARRLLWRAWFQQADVRLDLVCSFHSVTLLYVIIKHQKPILLKGQWQNWGGEGENETWLLESELQYWKLMLN